MFLKAIERVKEGKKVLGGRDIHIYKQKANKQETSAVQEE